MDSSVPLTHQDPRDLGLIWLIKKLKIRFRTLSDLRIQSWIFLKKRILSLYSGLFAAAAPVWYTGHYGQSVRGLCGQVWGSDGLLKSHNLIDPLRTLAAISKEIYALLVGWKVCIERNCDRGLENAVGKWVNCARGPYTAGQWYVHLFFPAVNWLASGFACANLSLIYLAYPPFVLS